MKSIVLVLSILAISNVSLAKGDKMSKEERKALVLSHIDKRIASLNEFKSCVNGKGDIKNCRKENRTRMEALKEDAKAARGK